jgi:hypothetical protein
VIQLGGLTDLSTNTNSAVALGRPGRGVVPLVRSWPPGGLYGPLGGNGALARSAGDADRLLKRPDRQRDIALNILTTEGQLLVEVLESGSDACSA